ncbi:MAG TPA: ABC transporter permease [Candidatus Dormibacteraeota bacterium]|nr:ABC transporter permease [Candidatus Dormibacteraeota bacterium]
MGALRNDLRYAIRTLWRSPGFTVIAILTLALGIGANAAIFSIVNAVVFRPLPYDDPARLVAIETRSLKQSELEPANSAHDFFDLRERAHSFSTLAAVSPIWSTVVTGGGPAERLETLFVSADLFPMLGIKPGVGRSFLPEEDNRKAPSKVVLVSYPYWQRHFGGDISAIGRSLQVDGEARTVVGVLPAQFHYLGGVLGASTAQTDLWLPLASNPLLNRSRSVRFLSVIGRLKPGATSEQVSAEMNGLWTGLVEQYPDTNSGFQIRVISFEQQAVGSVRPALLLLLGVAGFVLLIACTNVANLLLARTAARQKEIAVRKALGAPPSRLIRQLLTESLLLASVGGVVGFICASWSLRLLVSLGPASLPRRDQIALDASAILFTLIAIAVTAILCGVAPALEASIRNVNAALKEGGQASATANHRLRAGFVVCQMALATVLLIGAGLLALSFGRLLEVNPGFITKNVVTIATQAARGVSPQLYREIETHLRAVPGVRHVAAVSRLPLLGGNLGSWLLIEGRTFPSSQHPEVEYRVATPSYFATLGIPLVHGRIFDDHDDIHPEAVTLINETMAHRFWPNPNEDPLGKRIKLGLHPENSPWITIVGIVGDVRHIGLDVAPRAEVYRPYAYSPLYNPIFVVRTDNDSKTLLPQLREAFRSVSPDLPVYNVFLMTDLVDRSTATRRFPALLLSGFALLALVLAAVGIYGVISQSVAQRAHEIGVRLAVGATVGNIIALVLRQGLRLAAVGIAIGLVAGLALSRLIVSLLFGITAYDPAVFVLVPLTLVVVAALACAIPAYRGSRVDPLMALRSE